MTKYLPRENSKLISTALKTMPVVVLSGMRQTGKSTLLQRCDLFDKRRYFTFDDYNTLEIAQREPESLFSQDEEITIDEVQKYPEILNAIKRDVDKHRKPGRFILSGSANFLLLKNISETLAGRAVYLTLYPFSRRERLGHTKSCPALVHFISKGVFPKVYGIKPIGFDEILLGGMPSVALKQVKDSNIWFRGYEQTYLERDIRSLSQVADIVSFRHLLQLIALRNAQVLNQSELARDAKLNVMTTTRYISLMEASFVIFRLFPHLSNRTKRLIKSPKIYFSDSGLAAYLAGVKKLDNHEPLRGAFLENYVAQNLLEIISVYYPDAKITYWNIQGRFEVDFILELGRETVAVEVKYGSRIHENDIAGIKAYMSTSKSCSAGILVYNGTDVIKLSEKIWGVPISLFLS
ncbi:ATPase (AAA+ superfamily) [Candidatus Omnitrophus magneticus]|uniref:ATPase (AAA+ superfamily) n=1 Tax=Candidatus Omnitrophus magneticus TaxID=1609969 RepID=A0A0F0CT89_9BACT|nr:ATPase (AAA+ superfamily) [Candidatus Omnitrophus magneticus]